MYKLYIRDNQMKMIAIEYTLKDIIEDIDFLVEKKIMRFQVVENTQGLNKVIINSIDDYLRIKKEIEVENMNENVKIKRFDNKK